MSINRATLDVFNALLINDNTSQEIQPIDHREMNSYIFGSFVNLQDDVYKSNDGALEYINPVTSLWDSSPAHDNKLTPKSYVDGLFDSIDFTPYAKLDGSNMPFTGNFKQVVSGVTTEFSNGFLLLDSFRGVKPRTSGGTLVFGDGSGYITLSSLNSSFSLKSGYFEAKGSFRFLNSSGNYIGVYGGDANGGYLEIRDNTFGSSGNIIIDNRTTTNYNALFTKAIIIGDTSPTIAGAIRFNTTTNKHQGYDGTTWNDLY